MLPQAVGFFLLPLYTKYLNPGEFGILSSMMVIQAFFGIFITLSLENSAVRLFWDFKGIGKHRLFLGTISVVIFISIAFVFAIAILSQSLLQKIFPEISFYPYFFYALIISIFYSLSLVPKSYLRVVNKAKEYLIISTIEIISSVALILFFLLVKDEGVIGILKGKMYGAIIISPIFIYIIIKKFTLGFDLQMIKQAFAFSLPFIPNIFGAWAISGTDKIFIANYFTLDSVGLYSISLRIAGLIGVVATAFTFAYYPLFFETVFDKPESVAKDKLSKVNHLIIYILLIFFLFLSLFSKEAIFYLLNPNYLAAYKYVPIIGLAMVLNSITSVIIGASFQQSKKMKEHMVIGLSNMVVMVMLNFILIRQFNLSGAALSSLISSIYLFIISYSYSKKHCFFIAIDLKRVGLILISILLITGYLNYSKDLVNQYVSAFLKGGGFIIVLIVFYIKNKGLIKDARLN